MNAATERFDVYRFTHEEHQRGDTAGWKRTSPWFTGPVVTWAWFRREVDDGATRES